MWKAFRPLGNRDTKRKTSPRILSEAVRNALKEIRREETTMRFPAQYRPSETSHISLNDHFAAMQIDWPSEGGNGYRLTRSSLTPRISSRTIDPPVRGHPRPGKTAISYHNRQRCVNVPRPSTQGLSTVTLATLRPVQPVGECL